MKIFLDIGAHTGETLTVVRRPQWKFTRIYSFEPAPTCWSKLNAIIDSRVTVLPFGLWDQDEERVLYDAGSVAGSIAPDKGGEEALCKFRDASAWFRTHVPSEAEVFAKINVEGAEGVILRRLTDSGEIAKIDHLLVHLDVRKFASLSSEAAGVLRLLDESGIDYVLADRIMFGGVYRGTDAWLRWCHSTHWARDLRYMTLRRLAHPIRRALYPLKRRASAAAPLDPDV